MGRQGEACHHAGVSPPHRDEDPDERAPGAPGEAPGAGSDDAVAEGPPDAGDPSAAEVGQEVERPEAHDADELLWQQIVENYGDRPEWVEPPAGPHPDHPAGTGRRPQPAPAEASWQSEPPVDDDLQRGPEERFRPPTPPPLPWAKPPRLVAWFGLFGVPTIVLLALILGVALPPWLGVLLMVWFVGGFGYLVASMRPHGDDPDDGAVL